MYKKFNSHQTVITKTIFFLLDTFKKIAPMNKNNSCFQTKRNMRKGLLTGLILYFMGVFGITSATGASFWNVSPLVLTGDDSTLSQPETNGVIWGTAKSFPTWLESGIHNL